MHSSTPAFLDIAAIRAWCSTALFLRRDPANNTCMVIHHKRFTSAVTPYDLSSMLSIGRRYGTHSPSCKVLLLFLANLWLTPIYKPLEKQRDTVSCWPIDWTVADQWGRFSTSRWIEDENYLYLVPEVWKGLLIDQSPYHISDPQLQVQPSTQQPTWWWLNHQPIQLIKK